MSTTLSVNDLLAMYTTYKQLLDKQRNAEKQLARARLAGQPTDDTPYHLDMLARELQLLSDTMTFDTPRIWIEYKYRAYQDDPQPITTMHDLRLHCSKPGYICTTRYTFLNTALISAGKTPLSDRTVYPDDMNLSVLLADSSLDQLPEDTYDTWRQHEYHKDSEGNTAKWAAYKP